MWQVEYNISSYQLQISINNGKILKGVQRLHCFTNNDKKKIVGLFAIHSLQQETLIKKPMD
jgi:hypothetical protein